MRTAVPPPRRPLFNASAAVRKAPDHPVEAESRSERFTFFWRGPLSNWHPSRFVVDGVAYSHNEQFMMAEKARLFGDLATLAEIMKARSPKDQKALGRDVKPFDEQRWLAAAKDIVKRGARAKFEQNPDLKDVLMASAGTTLVEASPYDQLWGIGLGAADTRAQSRATWRGKNWLGEVLTELCDEFTLEMTPPRP